MDRTLSRKQRKLLHWQDVNCRFGWAKDPLTGDPDTRRLAAKKEHITCKQCRLKSAFKWTWKDINGKRSLCWVKKESVS